ncbi:hypothetical protein MPH_11218 [Macrophomina phaseolina MS6]|uniref:Uncharacterized protein n=1 Tax=Macrophomina phaseolina (strain MS6) TaxID=1126212 RepID=K2S4R7_MACPH|nr:hypothetical protein MPH_11218 [Macrophomina phaseolina MS6]
MLFSKLFSISAVVAASLVGGAVADKHNTCACNIIDNYNWRMTTKACDRYNEKGHPGGKVKYDTPSGMCMGDGEGNYVMGKEWEAACREAGDSGFACADGVGTCFQEDDSKVRGTCPGASWD